MGKNPTYDNNILLWKIENIDNTKVIKGTNDKIKKNQDIDLRLNFYTPYILQYEDFLVWNNDSSINKLIEDNIFNNQDIVESKNDSIIFPLFKFYDIYLEFDATWYRYTKLSFTRKHFLYIFYQFIFWIPTYTCLRKHYENLEFSIINKYEFDKIKENDKNDKKRIIELPVYYEAPDRTLQKWSNSYAEMWQSATLRWKWEIKYQSNNTEHQDIIITPIKIWTDDNYNIEALRKVLEKFAPNNEYDKKNIDTNPELSLRTDEIFEYFSTISKNERKLDNDNIKSRLLKEAGIENISDELLIQQMNIVENFLSNILK
jgi:hypothetical protein